MWEWEAPEETGLTVTVGDALAVEDLVYPGTGQRSPGHRREDDAVPPRAQVPEVAAGKPAVQLERRLRRADAERAVDPDEHLSNLPGHGCGALDTGDVGGAAGTDATALESAFAGM